jgi:hypothetical protein
MGLLLVRRRRWVRAAARGVMLCVGQRHSGEPDR